MAVEGKALLVEDETLVAMIAEEILLSIGFEPVCVMSLPISSTRVGTFDFLKAR